MADRRTHKWRPLIGECILCVSQKWTHAAIFLKTFHCLQRLFEYFDEFFFRENRQSVDISFSTWYLYCFLSLVYNCKYLNVWYKIFTQEIVSKLTIQLNLFKLQITVKLKRRLLWKMAFQKVCNCFCGFSLTVIPHYMRAFLYHDTFK